MLPHSLMAFSLNSSGVPGGVQLFPVTQCLHGEGDGDLFFVRGKELQAGSATRSQTGQNSSKHAVCWAWHGMAPCRGKCWQLHQNCLFSTCTFPKSCLAAVC